MRTLIALTVFVYLAPGCLAEDWAQLDDKGREAVKQKDFVAAARYFQQSQALAKTQNEAAVSANDLGIALHQSGREAEARKWLQQALDFWKSDVAHGANIPDTTLSLATAERMMGDYGSAESLLRSLLGQPDLTGESRSRLLSYLGDLMREEGHFREARVLVEQADDVPGLSWKRHLEGKVFAAQLDRDTHNWDASIEEWNAGAVLAREKGETGVEAACLRGLGQTWLERGNLARAEPLLKRALTMHEAEAFSDETETALVLADLGQLYLAEDKSAMAEEVLNRALAGEEHGFGPTHPQVALVLEMLGDSLARRNQMELARSYFNRAEKIMSGQFGASSVMAAGVRASWGSVEQRAGQPERAAEQYQKALEVLNVTGSDFDPVRLRVMKQYAQVLKASHHNHEAKDVLVQVRNFQAR